MKSIQFVFLLIMLFLVSCSEDTNFVENRSSLIYAGDSALSMIHAYSQGNKISLVVMKEFPRENVKPLTIGYRKLPNGSWEVKCHISQSEAINLVEHNGIYWIGDEEVFWLDVEITEDFLVKLKDIVEKDSILTLSSMDEIMKVNNLLVRSGKSDNVPELCWQKFAVIHTDYDGKIPPLISPGLQK